MLVHWIWLSQKKKVTIRQKIALLEFFRDPEAIYMADETAYAQIEGITDTAIRALADKELFAARDVLTRCSERNISILTYNDGAYPKRLKNIEVPPLVLFYKGVLPPWQDRPVIGVVGTRKATGAGLQNAEKLGYEIAACGGLVVSGGADGIDAAALKGAMQAGEKVVAVLGFGADIVYPASHKALFEQIEKQGCLITEYVPGTPARSWNFPMRNRIVSGLSAGVLVVEAPEKSGALNTAKHAMDQGKDLFVVPGNIGQSNCAGSNGLLKERAMPVASGWDIVGEYEGLYPYAVKRFQGKCPVSAVADHTPEYPKQESAPRRKSDKNGIDNQEKSRYSVLENEQSALSREEQQVIKHLSDQPVPVDALLDMVELPSGKALSVLTMLALKGLVTNHPGNRVSLSNR